MSRAGPSPASNWRYDHYDRLNHTFVYAVRGEIGETAKLSGTICNGTGLGSAGHATWPFPDTDFPIDYSETHDKGTPLAKPESPPTVARTGNPGGPSSLTQPWLDLRTYAGACGPVSTRVGAATLTDHGVQAGAINYDWTVTAYVA